MFSLVHLYSFYKSTHPSHSDDPGNLDLENAVDDDTSEDEANNGVTVVSAETEIQNNGNQDNRAGEAVRKVSVSSISSTSSLPVPTQNSPAGSRRVSRDNGRRMSRDNGRPASAKLATRKRSFDLAVLSGAAVRRDSALEVGLQLLNTIKSDLHLLPSTASVEELTATSELTDYLAPMTFGLVDSKSGVKDGVSERAGTAADLTLRRAETAMKWRDTAASDVITADSTVTSEGPTVNSSTGSDVKCCNNNRNGDSTELSNTPGLSTTDNCNKYLNHDNKPHTSGDGGRDLLSDSGIHLEDGGVAIGYQGSPSLTWLSSYESMDGDMTGSMLNSIEDDVKGQGQASLQKSPLQSQTDNDQAVSYQPNTSSNKLSSGANSKTNIFSQVKESVYGSNNGLHSHNYHHVHHAVEDVNSGKDHYHGSSRRLVVSDEETAAAETCWLCSQDAQQCTAKQRHHHSSFHPRFTSSSISNLLMTSDIIGRTKTNFSTGQGRDLPYEHGEIGELLTTTREFLDQRDAEIDELLSWSSSDATARRRRRQVGHVRMVSDLGSGLDLRHKTGESTMADTGETVDGTGASPAAKSHDGAVVTDSVDGTDDVRPVNGHHKQNGGDDIEVKVNGENGVKAEDETGTGSRREHHDSLVPREIEYEDLFVDSQAETETENEEEEEYDVEQHVQLDSEGEEDQGQDEDGANLTPRGPRRETVTDDVTQEGEGQCGEDEVLLTPRVASGQDAAPQFPTASVPSLSCVEEETKSKVKVVENNEKVVSVDIVSTEHASLPSNQTGDGDKDADWSSASIGPKVTVKLTPPQTNNTSADGDNKTTTDKTTTDNTQAANKQKEDVNISSQDAKAVETLKEIEAMKNELQSIHGAYEAAMARLKQAELQVQQLRVENSALQSRSAVDDSREMELEILRDELRKVRSHNGRLVAENTKLADRVTELEVVLGGSLHHDDDRATPTLPLTNGSVSRPPLQKSSSGSSESTVELTAVEPTSYRGRPPVEDCLERDSGHRRPAGRDQTSAGARHVSLDRGLALNLAGVSSAPATDQRLQRIIQPTPTNKQLVPPSIRQPQQQIPYGSSSRQAATSSSASTSPASRSLSRDRQQQPEQQDSGRGPYYPSSVASSVYSSSDYPQSLPVTEPRIGSMRGGAFRALPAKEMDVSTRRLVEKYTTLMAAGDSSDTSSYSRAQYPYQRQTYSRQQQHQQRDGDDEENATLNQTWSAGDAPADTSYPDDDRANIDQVWSTSYSGWTAAARSGSFSSLRNPQTPGSRSGRASPATAPTTPRSLLASRPLPYQANKHNPYTPPAPLYSSSLGGSSNSITAGRIPVLPRSPADLHLGDVVKFARHDGHISRGRVHYVGHLANRNEVYVGLELDNELGKHDGVFEGSRYFQCKANRGVFVTFSKVVLVWSSS